MTVTFGSRAAREPIAGCLGSPELLGSGACTWFVVRAGRLWALLARNRGGDCSAASHALGLLSGPVCQVGDSDMRAVRARLEQPSRRGSRGHCQEPPCGCGRGPAPLADVVGQDPEMGRRHASVEVAGRARGHCSGRAGAPCAGARAAPLGGSSTTLHDHSRVTVETAARGPGPASSVHAPREVWEQWADPDFGGRGARVGALPPSRCPKVAALLSTLHAHGLVDLVDGPANAEVFVKWKNERKCALIINMRIYNRRCRFKVRCFKLPSLEALATVVWACLGCPGT